MPVRQNMLNIDGSRKEISVDISKLQSQVNCLKMKNSAFKFLTNLQKPYLYLTAV